MKITEINALKLLAKKYKGDESHIELVDKIQSLLLSKVRSSADLIIIAELLKDKALAKYEIVADNSINLFTPEQVQQITQAIDVHVGSNKSGAKVVLSVGESLLLVIQACKKAQVNDDIISKLKALYLDGIKSEKDKTFLTHIKWLLADTKHFNVSTDPKVSNADSTRRYFETHLAYHLLQPNAEALETDKLRASSMNLKANLWKALSTKPNEKIAVEYILDGNMHSSLNKYQLEYAEVISKLKNHNYHGLSPKACDNLCQIAISTILSTLNTQYDSSIPADIYEDSIFTMGMDGRGRIIKKEHDTVRTGAKGIMLSTSPMPRNDLAGEGDTEEYEVPLYQDAVDERGDPILDKNGKVKRIPVTEIVMDSNGIEKEVAVTVKRVRMVVSPFQRSADQSSFMIESQWSQHLFGRQTQVYSNGISSTTLATIRNILMQKRAGNPFHGEYFKEYMNAFAALMIYNSGGHSLFEIFEVFKLPQLNEVMEGAGCKELLDHDELMQQWLLKDQPEAFDKAMDETIEYLEQLIHRRALNSQLHHWVKEDATLKAAGTNEVHDISEELALESLAGDTAPQLLSLHRAVLTLDAVKFREYLKTTVDINLNELNSSKYTPLMVAAQIGKLDHVQALVAAGANPKLHIKQKNQPHGLTALDLALKSEQYLVVLYLLKLPGFSIKKIGSGFERFDTRNLKERAPALYFACRQSDVRILEAVVKSAPELTLKDKILAIIETVKVENIEGTMKLATLLTHMEINNISLSDKQHLLNIAAERGNPALLGKLLGSQIAPNQAQIDYDAMLLQASNRGYVPIARLLLSEALHNETLPKNALLDKLMLTALANGHYDIAILFILYGADPDQIAINNERLSGFTHYLRTTPPEHYNAFFSNSDRAMIAERTASLKEKYAGRTTGLWRTFVDLLVRFLSILPLVNLGGYYQKTEVIARLSFQVITDEKPKKDYEIGYDEASDPGIKDSEHQNSEGVLPSNTKENSDSTNLSRLGMFSSSRPAYDEYASNNYDEYAQRPQTGNY